MIETKSLLTCHVVAIPVWPGEGEGILDLLWQLGGSAVCPKDILVSL